MLMHIDSDPRPRGPELTPAGSHLLPPGLPVVVIPTEPLDAAGHNARGSEMLHEVARAGDAAAVRFYTPPPTASFSSMDRLSAGYPAAVAAATELGFAPVVRAPGGRMAAYHQGTLCLDLAVPDRAGGGDTWSQLRRLSELLVDVLTACGVPAGLGPVPGEYCPGRYSVHGADRIKLAGTAARRVRGATLFGVVLVVADADPLRTVLTSVYRHLNLDLDPGTVGAVQDLTPGLTVTAVQAAIQEALVRTQEPPGP